MGAERTANAENNETRRGHRRTYGVTRPFLRVAGRRGACGSIGFERPKVLFSPMAGRKLNAGHLLGVLSYCSSSIGLAGSRREPFEFKPAALAPSVGGAPGSGPGR